MHPDLIPKSPGDDADEWLSVCILGCALGNSPEPIHHSQTQLVRNFQSRCNPLVLGSMVGRQRVAGLDRGGIQVTLIQRFPIFLCHPCSASNQVAHLRAPSRLINQLLNQNALNSFKLIGIQLFGCFYNYYTSARIMTGLSADATALFARMRLPCATTTRTRFLP